MKNSKLFNKIFDGLHIYEKKYDEKNGIMYYHFCFDVLCSMAVTVSKNTQVEQEKIKEQVAAKMYFELTSYRKQEAYRLLSELLKQKSLIDDPVFAKLVFDFETFCREEL